MPRACWDGALKGGGAFHSTLILIDPNPLSSNFRTKLNDTEIDKTVCGGGSVIPSPYNNRCGIYSGFHFLLAHYVPPFEHVKD